MDKLIYSRNPLSSSISSKRFINLNFRSGPAWHLTWKKTLVMESVDRNIIMFAISRNYHSLHVYLLYLPTYNSARAQFSNYRESCSKSRPGGVSHAIPKSWTCSLINCRLPCITLRGESRIFIGGRGGGGARLCAPCAHALTSLIFKHSETNWD